MARIGITTTVPVEIILAAGHIPVDLNNIFITSPAAGRMVETAEEAGYPRNICGWIKGLYAVMVNKEFNASCGGIDKVIAVTQGDCSNTHALMETYQLAGIETIPFAYPFDRDYDLLKLQMEKLMATLGTNWETVYGVKRQLDKLRLNVAEIDRRTWQENTVSGLHNHLYQVSCSDFNSDTNTFASDVERFLQQADNASEYTDDLRLGFIGVPPIFTDLYPYLETMGARIVYNEVQRQFAMPFAADDIVEQYRLYTYPYGVFGRIHDIETEIERRNLDGLIHYVQSFCFRQIEDMIFREKLTIPILTIEGDKPGKLDARTRLRLESFLEMLR
ncbi:2-hydroxyglutaryl-CoA dehydratase, D-component [Sporomusa ovata DSM 2662]|uniref:Possible subunit of benzoyl-CoA reductase/2-hydroxyglutaryl-CoA dehydratase n=1 Tax=Sporomusa ovata TaxID=2378 RepID=A0A0U1KXT0_9FIRM|nr:2-hydroxyacyl-CoA dehydratase [Sporomusa ovata]EQB28774.1 benzoyl-CoA reductase/2-hydroxyglutaryl-CoA dehydratase subunit HgdB [Sporomusa ovata DSM 2662]CQR71929.1 Possible subunit of benzoyl-CoA reductase/2-hydroxyglutaryl-CoA dehydratase [Sporomusa ovata]